MKLTEDKLHERFAPRSTGSAAFDVLPSRTIHFSKQHRERMMAIKAQAQQAALSNEARTVRMYRVRSVVAGSLALLVFAMLFLGLRSGYFSLFSSGQKQATELQQQTSAALQSSADPEQLSQTNEQAASNVMPVLPKKDESVIYPGENIENIKNSAIFSTSMAYEPTFENLWDNASIVALVKMNERISSGFLGESYPWASTKVAAETLKVFKGQLSPTAEFYLSGGTVTVSQFQDAYKASPSADNVWQKSDTQAQVHDYIDVYPENYIDAKAGETYLLFLIRNEHGKFTANDITKYPDDYLMQIGDGYATYLYDDESDSVYNPLSNERLTLAELSDFATKKMSTVPDTLPEYEEASLLRAKVESSDVFVRYTEDDLIVQNVVKNDLTNEGLLSSEIMLAKPIKLVSVDYFRAHDSLPFSYINFEVIGSIQGDFEAEELVAVKGGTIKMQSLMNHLSPEQNSAYGYDKLSEEERSTLLAELYSTDFVDIVEGQTYLLVMQRRETDNSLAVFRGGFGIFLYEESSDTIYNPLSKTKLTLDELREILSSNE